MPSPQQQTRAWLTDFVIKLNLCPFAQKVLEEDSIRIALCSSNDEQEMVRQVLAELDLLVQSDPKTLSTSLLVFDQALADFHDYLDFADWANDLLLEAGLEGTLQIATFHPQYVFAGVAEDDVSHYSNRSPFPMLHFIREQQLEQAIAHHPDPESIPDTNIKHLQGLGLAKVLSLLHNISQ
ncbi:DUF1415 domain-containing protein [Dasania sp. GY-MA-18]|uniref:DUF1415 domain-containing protein n=1 Tax=Dasania phycosphaerae TaxID=2950436 RepID=A0A9J6RKF4_9GAMM|nr:MULTISPECIES: DUF1415 domain-containing protein [Dasania]MCR8922033.1 DUF1415 domain-containing protein [Dasania sp. GY-MA-18]MCZ0864461.1 DUF1415 domain-containing protein [Dasania phycosphaerae]MCZ0868189.1 DUF1415 domain-containing protein [Dasania phycosphaerae]